MNTTVRRAWSILRIAILVFLIVGVVDIFMIASLVFRTLQSSLSITALSEPMANNLREPPRLYTPPDSQISDNAFSENINYKRLHIEIDPTRVTATYDVYLKKDHPLFVRAETATHPQSAQTITDEVLGAVSVSTHKLKFEQIETEIAETDESGHFYVRAAPSRLALSSYTVTIYPRQHNGTLNIGSQEVIVYTRGVSVRSYQPYIPVSKTLEETRYILPASARGISFLVELKDQVPPAAPPQTTETLAVLLQKNISVPGLHALLMGLLEAIPFIIFVVWCRRNACAIPDAHSQQRVIETYLVFHFSYFYLYALSDLIETWRSPFMLALSYFEQRTLPAFAASNYIRETYVLWPLMALFIYGWPKLAHAWTEPPIQRTPRWFQRLRNILRALMKALAVLIFVSLIVVVAWLLINRWDTMRTDLTRLTVAEFYSLFSSVLVLALYLLVLLVGRFIRVPRRLGFALNFILLLLVLMAAEIFFVFAGENRYLWFAKGVLRLVIFVVSAIAIVWAFALPGYRAFTGRSLYDDWLEWHAKQRVLLVVVVAVVALSNRYWTWPVAYWPLWWLAWAIKDLFFIVLVWYLAKFLRRVSADYPWLELPPLARHAGILLALFMFYSPLNRWHYIPVSFISGYFLLKFWLLPEKQFDRGAFSDIKANLKRLIDRVIAFNDAEHALHSLKKELLTKLGKGDLEPQQYANKLEAQAGALAECRSALMVHNQFAKDHVLALGPGDSAWKNGCRAAIYSLLFSIPWSALYFRDLVRAPAGSESYLFLEIVANVGYFFLTWISYGFIFGYFYPHIRGNNGIHKALVMFLTIVVPELVWTAVARPVDTANWTSFGFWTLQIFAHTMLLGMVAGDLAIMRAHGFNWRQLLDFHKLTALSAWTSSVILAIAAAAGTLIASGATEILASALRYMGVIPQDLKLPKG